MDFALFKGWNLPNWHNSEPLLRLQKIAVFNLLDSQEMISRKIWVIENSKISTLWVVRVKGLSSLFLKRIVRCKIAWKINRFSGCFLPKSYFFYVKLTFKVLELFFSFFSQLFFPFFLGLNLFSLEAIFANVNQSRGKTFQEVLESIKYFFPTLVLKVKRSASSV